MPFEDQRTRSALAPCRRPCHGLRGSCVGSALFGGGEGWLMKYPCQFNRVTSPVSHPKTDDPRAPLLSLQARGNILSANKPLPRGSSESSETSPLPSPSFPEFRELSAFSALLNSFAVRGEINREYHRLLSSGYALRWSGRRVGLANGRKKWYIPARISGAHGRMPLSVIPVT